MFARPLRYIDTVRGVELDPLLCYEQGSECPPERSLICVGLHDTYGNRSSLAIPHEEEINQRSI